LLFALGEGITVFPLAKEHAWVDVKINGLDRTKELRRGGVINMMAPGDASGTVEIFLTLEEAIPVSVAGGVISLLIDLETPLSILPQWLADPATAIGPPSTVKWLYTSGAQSKTSEFDPTKTTDGTGGLRRSGTVRLAIPKDWQAEPPSGIWKPRYRIVLQIANAGYTAIPRLLRIAPNVAVARHIWSRVKHPRTKDWLPLPGNVVSLPDVPGDSTLAEYPPIEDTVQVRVTERDGLQYDWKRVASLSFSGPADRVFVVDRRMKQIRFGDGLTGRLPVVARKSDSEIEVSYQAGGGADGNVGAMLDWQAVKISKTDPEPHLIAVNVVKGESGAETETLADAKLRSTAALRERNRAVTAADYENLAVTTPGAGLRRAHAEVGFDPEFPCGKVPGAISVFVVPYAPRESTDPGFDPDLFVAAPQPDPAALMAARDRINSGRLLGTEVFVLPPAYRSTWLEVDVSANGVLSADLRERVALRLRKFLDPLEGGSDGTGWPFGEPLRPSTLLREAQDVLASTADVQRVLVRVRGMDKTEGCVDVLIAPYELILLEQVLVRVTSQAAPSGGLR
jgi:predicted phage baseplate assembly protein